MKKLIVAFLAALLLIAPLGYAAAQSSKATLNTEIDTNWPDNTSGLITPALLRNTVKDIVASYVDWLTCTAQGGILYWGAAGTPACLTASTSGYVLKTQGAGANPAWTANTADIITIATDFRFLGNSAGANKAAQELSANTLFDWLYSTRGGIFYRGAASWAGLAAGTSGYVLKTSGAGADPAWADPISLLVFAGSQRVLGRVAAGTGASELTANTIFDWIGSTRGSLFFRDATTWAELTPGTAGYVLTTQGAGANPTWVNPAAGGTVTSISCGLGLDCTGAAPITTAGTITPTIATTAQTWAGAANKLIDAAHLRSGGQFASLVSVSPTIAVDFSLGVNFSLPLTGSIQLGNPSNMTPGATGCIFISKDLTSRTLSYNTFWKFAGGTAPVLSTTTTTVPDALCYLVYSSTAAWATMTKAIQ